MRVIVVVAEDSVVVEVIDKDGGVHEGGDGDEVFRGGLVCGEESVGGLAGGDVDGVGGEWFRVGGVDLDDGEVVVGDLEEQLIVDCCVDYS